MHADAKRISELVKASAAAPAPCCLCEAPTRSRGVFAPYRSTDFGAPDGKQRVLIYPICGGHKMTPESHRRIEGLLIGKLTTASIVRVS